MAIDEKKLRKAEKALGHAIHNKKKPGGSEWYSIRSLFGNTWAFFYIILGGREAGKSYAVMEQFIRDWKYKGKPFTWLRLTEASTKKMLSNKADKLVDADIRRKYDLDLTVKGCQVFDHGQPMAKVLALSTFYNDKGVALFDNEFDLGYNIALDEMNREVAERNTFDISYSFVNQMENLVRSTKEKLRIVLIGNTLEEAGDILCLFDFIPEHFGRFKVRKKRAIIDYIEPTERYKARRQGTVADLLMPEASTFTNKIDVDKSLVYKGPLKKPTAIIVFSKTEKYTVGMEK
jgi:Podovirus DNA encapsidation protein (Gp16).